MPTLLPRRQTHARYILAHKPDAKIAVLYMNDDTKEGVKGLKDGSVTRPTNSSSKSLVYEITDPTIDLQMSTFKASGADTFYNMSASEIRRAGDPQGSEIGWKPLHFLISISQSISAVLEPAGLENSIGIISAHLC